MGSADPGARPAGEDNSPAGQGSVVLDIGGDVGALLVTMPAALEGQEIEIWPVGQPRPAPDPAHSHDHPHEHPHGDEYLHGKPVPHVAVVGRQVNGQIVYSAVYGSLLAGGYELWIKPDGPVMLRADVSGGAVTQAAWPD